MKKRFCWFFLFVVLFFGFFNLSCVFAETALYLESEGWCVGTPILFRVYNITDYLNRSYIINRRTVDFNNISADVEIRRGPFRSSPLIFTGKTNKSGHFWYNFSQVGDYHIEITPTEGNYSNLMEVKEILSCKERKEGIALYNRSFDYDLIGVHVDIFNTMINLSSDLTVRALGETQAVGFPPIEDVIKRLEITAEGKSFSSLVVEAEVNVSDNVTLKVFKYNSKKYGWDEVSFEMVKNKVVFSPTEFGVFFFVAREKKVGEVSEVVEEFNQTALEQERILAEQKEEESKIRRWWLQGVLIIVLVLVLWKVFMARKKSEEEGFFAKEEVKSVDEAKKREVGNVIYDKTKDYVKRYKGEFSRDQIYRALVNANVSKEVIDKVFNEEYK